MADAPVQAPQMQAYGGSEMADYVDHDEFRLRCQGLDFSKVHTPPIDELYEKLSFFMLTVSAPPRP